MNKLKRHVPDHILHTLYGILVWANTCKTYSNKLVELQKINGLLEQYHIATIEATRGHFSKHTILTVNECIISN